MGSFSSDGAFAGQSYSLVVPCYLIRHPDGILLWDTGFGEALADTPGGIEGGGFRSSLSSKLSDQLDQLGLSVDDVDFLSISHAHPDHIGNGDLFADATFIISKAERAYMFSEEALANMAGFGGGYTALEYAKTTLFDTEYDVFGDGRVLIKTLPGHTPGSAVLLVSLERAGPVLLTGDLFTHAAGRRLGAVPAFNTNVAQTRASIRGFEALAKETGARVIIQHEPEDFGIIPTFPGWLD